MSFSKGCYIGQEIIARLESRGRLAKRLVGARLSSAIEPNAALYQGSAKVGTLTSVVRSPNLGWIGLASVRPEAVDRNAGGVSVGENRAVGTLVELPFRSATTPIQA